MVSLKHLVIALLSLGLGLAGTAAAGTRSYSLGNESGGQLQIGGGLPLPIQVVNKVPPTPSGIPTYTGAKFPPLLIPVVQSASISQTTTKTGMARMIMVPKGVLSKPAAFTILGQFNNNPNLYAVATNIKYTWPASAAVFSTAARTGATATVYNAGGGRTITFSNALGRKFGGPAQFALSIGAPSSPMGGAGPPGSLNSGAGATLYAVAVKPTGNPPCTHTAFAGPNPACVAAIAFALPTASGSFAAGGGQPAAAVNVMTPGGTPGHLPGGPIPGIGVVKAGTGAGHPTGPRGSITLFAYTPGGMSGFTNMANSFGQPWTTGMLTVKATAAAGAAETFVLTGMDLRNGNGIGRLQMVSGAVSTRTATLDNANRGWIRLDILQLKPANVPALSPLSLAAMAGLMLLAAGYTMRRRFSA